ncbi:uncharacterized protein L969DRAFT_95441 [Mixia osmundae IAM 14324]|uniref:Golgi apyrase n=1 Tax=Mixia osmundae (strain CBS 9802 / IAM 14324 / JCM 22182 / KY 12970) TaxID=764103 RepID=G7E0I4_MIXOS|nr:uncharacterized protein L969DRAFT_95441 [Mixia osmundae IAM 14324]KEI38354.1 hypothetical protein L969DRAFT_95441 [Mixia osmundae IAM 14324]GAA96344.1 hypothetical protein E5Q_03010 [Mixia osmundae IAM 14324]
MPSLKALGKRRALDDDALASAFSLTPAVQDAALAARAPSPSWSTGRQFGIVVDAGSSGSRLQVYSWLEHDLARQELRAKGEGLSSMPKVTKGVEKGDDWHIKVEPGLSSLGPNPAGVGDYLQPLLDHALRIVPPDKVASTPIHVLATAGMRLLPDEQRIAVLQETCRYIQKHADFRLTDCASQVRVITGEEEGVFGWVAVNYLMDGFDSHVHTDQGGHNDHLTSSTFGFLDMGGASTQIAFEPTAKERAHDPAPLVDVRLRLLDGKDVVHPVFVTTWLGYGTNKARERYVDSQIGVYQETHPEPEHAIESEKPVVMVQDPCLPKDLVLQERRHAGYALQGTGDFVACLKRTSPLLNKEAQCEVKPCLFNGVHVPRIDFSVNHFIGISEYFYSTHDVWDKGGPYDFVEFEKNALQFCARDWKEIQADYAAGGKWKPNVNLDRLEMQCFKAAWLISILHEGIGLPRLHDKGGKGDGTDHAKEAIQQAGEKGLTDLASFQSLAEVGDVEVSWTLGKMILEVSQSVQPIEGVKSLPDALHPPSLQDQIGLPGDATWQARLRARANGNESIAIAAIVFVLLLCWWLLLGSNAKAHRQAVFRCCEPRARQKGRESDYVRLNGLEDGSGLRTPASYAASSSKRLPWWLDLTSIRVISRNMLSNLKNFARRRQPSNTYLPTHAAPQARRPSLLHHSASSPVLHQWERVSSPRTSPEIAAHQSHHSAGQYSLGIANRSESLLAATEPYYSASLTPSAAGGMGWPGPAIKRPKSRNGHTRNATSEGFISVHLLNGNAPPSLPVAHEVAEATASASPRMSGDDLNGPSAFERASASRTSSVNTLSRSNSSLNLAASYRRKGAA